MKLRPASCDTAGLYLEAREDLETVRDKAVADRAPILGIRQHGEGVVMIPASVWTGMEETLHLLSSPANAKHLIEGTKRLDAGGGEARGIVRP